MLLKERRKLMSFERRRMLRHRIKRSLKKRNRSDNYLFLLI